MTNLPSRSMLGALALVVLVSLGVTVQSTATADNNKAKMEVLDLPGTQLKIDATTISEIDGAPVLAYSVTNKGGEAVTVSDFLLLVFDKEGELKLGQGWRERTTIEPFASKPFSAKLLRETFKGDRIILAVDRTVTPSSSLETPDVIGNIKQYVKGKVSVLPKAERGAPTVAGLRFAKTSFAPQTGTPTQTETYCDNKRKSSAAECPCGISSFSCTENVSYSFSCFQCPPQGGGGGGKQPIRDTE